MSEARSAVAAIVSSAGRHRVDRLIQRLTIALADRGPLRCAIVASSEEATLAARAAAATAELVIAVGGDGTVADVATGIFGSRASLGIIPTGSTNITARTLGIPARLATAIALMSGPFQLRPIDIGLSGDRAFLHIAGAGFDAELFRVANRDWKRRVGWVAYLPAAVTALRLPPADVRVRAEDEIIATRSALVLIANGASVITPAFRIHPQITVDDGWLDVLVFETATLGEVAATLGHAGTLQLDKSPHVIWRRARDIVVEADPPLAVQLDGDVRGVTPVAFSIVPRGLNVVIPIT
jgi:YegS/Rv2252/BmrU family lipid kinase